MRWAETQKHEVTGADGAPLKVETAIDVAGLSVAALEELANLRKK
jgi:hypothetical protein